MNKWIFAVALFALALASPASAAVLSFESLFGNMLCIGDSGGFRACIEYPVSEENEYLYLSALYESGIHGPGIEPPPYINGNDLIYPVSGFRRFGDLFGFFSPSGVFEITGPRNFTRITFFYEGSGSAAAEFHFGMGANGQQITGLALGGGEPVTMIMDLASPSNYLAFELDVAVRPSYDSAAGGIGGFLAFTMEPATTSTSTTPEPGTWIAGAALVLVAFTSRRHQKR